MKKWIKNLNETQTIITYLISTGFTIPQEMLEYAKKAKTSHNFLKGYEGRTFITYIGGSKTFSTNEMKESISFSYRKSKAKDLTKIQKAFINGWCEAIFHKRVF